MANRSYERCLGSGRGAVDLSWDLRTGKCARCRRRLRLTKRGRLYVHGRGK